VAPAEREALARLWERAAALGGGLLMVEAEDLEAGDARRAVIAWVDELQAGLLMASRQPLPAGRRDLLRLHVPSLARQEQRALWQSSLGPIAEQLDGHLDTVLAQFSLNQRAIQAAGAQVVGSIRSGDGNELAELLWDACRVQAHLRLEDLAQ